MKYIDSEKLIAEIERRLNIVEPHKDTFESAAACRQELIWMKDFIASLQQEQAKGNLEYWLEHFGMPKENIDNCITQIAQGYGACRYFEGIQHGAEAVNELAKQEQPEVELKKEMEEYFKGWTETDEGIACHYQYVDLNTCRGIARHFFNLGLNARKGE